MKVILRREEKDLTRLLLPQLGKYWKKFRKMTREVQKEATPDAVHDLRVSTRRLDSLITVFDEYETGIRIKKFRSEIKRIMKPFGNLRDLHVQYDLLQKSISSSEKETFISPYLIEISQKFKKKEELLKNHIKNLNFSESRKLITLLLSRKKIILNDNETFNFIVEKGLSHPATRTMLQKNLMKCFSYLPLIRDEANVHEFHQLRIAIKKLRYKLEILKSLVIKNLPEEGMTFFEEIQDAMGEAHDIDVAIEDVKIFIKKKDASIIKKEEYKEWKKSICKKRHNFHKTSCNLLEKLQMLNFYSTPEK
jgi:CHAD domain-containing protein